MAKSRVISAVLKLTDENFVKTARKVNKSTTDMERGVIKTGNSVKKFGRNAKHSFKSAALSATAMVGSFMAVRGVKNLVQSSISTFADFEQGMANVQATTGKTGAEFESLKDKAREMGRSTSKTAAEAAEGLNYLGLAGWSTQEMVAGIEPVLRLSEAGALDLGRASDLATDSMAAMGLEVNQLDEYLDKVAQTSRKSNTNIDALMEGMVVAGGTFARLNTPMAESNAIMGVLANRGTKGAEAGTAINAIMDRLTNTSGPAGKAMEKLGKQVNGTAIKAFDSQGNFRGVETVLKDVEKAMSGLTDKEKAYYQSQIAGLNHGKSFQKIIDGLGDEYDQLKKDIEGADGALNEMAETQMDTFQGAMVKMGSAIDDVKITLGEGLAPVIRKFAEYIADNMPAIQQKVETAVNGAKEVMKDMMVSWKEGTGVVGAVKGAFDLANSAINWIVENKDFVMNAVIGVVSTIATFKIINGIASAVSAFNLILGAMRAGTVAATLAQLGLNMAMLANPYAWVAVAIGALIALAVDVARKWDDTKTVWENVWSSIQRNAATGVNAVIGSINKLIGMINKIPGVNVPIIPKVDWGAVESATNGASAAPKGQSQVAQASYAVGTNRVPSDMLANIHKDEMIVPAKQSAVLRQHGITIDNIHHMASKQSNPVAVANKTPKQSNASDTETNALINAIYALISVLGNKGPQDLNINIDARDKSVQEIMNELIPILKLRLANM